MEESSSHLTDLAALSDSGDSATAAAAAETEALRRLGDNFGSLLPSPRFADARIAVGGREVAVHRCVLAARSAFLRDELEKREKEGREARLELGELLKDYAVGYEALVFVLGYVYGGRVAPLPSGVCECVDEECNHAACRPALDFMAQVLYASFVFQISELSSVFQRHLLIILDKVAIDDIAVILYVANLCSGSCTQLLEQCILVVVKSDLDVVTLEKALPRLVVEQINQWCSHLGLNRPERTGLCDKYMKNIYGALETDDIELVKWLLAEHGTFTLDDVYGLHHAVAYCDLKIVATILDLGLADVNHKNLRGYTVLHIASMRKEPKIIMSLLNKGARPFELAPDGRRALQIAKRLTRSMDYDRSKKEVKTLSEDQLCIEILEQAERRDPLIEEDSISPAMDGCSLRETLLYLENRVHLARLIFPKEAKLAMDIAETNGTLEFRITVGICETLEEHRSRMRALLRTVKLGKCFFPRCSEYLDRLVDDDFSKPETSEEQKRRYKEIQDEMQRICNAEHFNRPAFSSSSSSTTGKRVRAKIAQRSLA